MKAPATLIAALLGLGLLSSAHATVPNSSNRPAKAATHSKADVDFHPGLRVKPGAPPGSADYGLSQASSNLNPISGFLKITPQDDAGVEVYPTAPAIELFMDEQHDTADRSAVDGSVPALNFIPGGNDHLGEISPMQGLHTYAASYNSGSVGLIDSSLKSYGYTPVIPEPETYALMLAGLGLVGFARRRTLRKE